MNFKSFVLLILSLTISVNAQAQPEHYVAQILRHSEVEGNSLISLGGIVINDRHILTSAAPLFNIPTDELRVFFSSATASISSDIREVLSVHINPNNTNLAILKTSWQQNEAKHLELGGLPPAGSQCRAYFFPDSSGQLIVADLTLREANCRFNNDWCANVNMTIATCSGFNGAPVICTEDNRIAGIIFGESACASPGSPLGPVANLINVAAHVEWIEEVTRDESYGDSASMSGILVGMLVVSVVLSKIL